MSPRQRCAERDARVWELYLQGLRYAVIGQRMGMHEKTVAAAVNRHPDFPNHKPPREPARRRVPQATARARVSARRFDDDPGQSAHLRRGIAEFRAMLEARYPTPTDGQTQLRRVAEMVEDMVTVRPLPAFERARGRYRETAE